MDEEKPKIRGSEPSHSHGDAPRVTWDEETIALHNLDRGTRTKIDEPNTPYHYYAEADGVGGVSPARSFSGECPPIQWDELQSKLQNVKDNKTNDWDFKNDKIVGSASGEMEFGARDSEGKKIRKDPNFEEKRKSHYNEFERVRDWKMQNGSEEDEDDEDEDEQPYSEEIQAAQP
ncbi:unnamed protein product [Peronospora belbahrii]|uniref:Protein phosphatase inhibitor 2 n=1 Tax=Peronospora belbahrii TaxID=622444 RepID=A0AAU9LGK3_9STRA|nr:unnamed protein product [Peronospora belbahrii]CAH0521818.1 unnamed protein product [Peronospora belbahrii]